jgi:5-oxoprolinase (ATP-hydrolysing) subunit C
MSLRVLRPGTHSLLVAAGRPTNRHRGVSLGGPADRAAWAIGNALVGNSPDAVALEVTLSGPTLRAEVDVGLCLFGAPFQLRRDDETLPAAATFPLRSGQELAIGGTASGARAYLCAAGGGFEAPEVLGSRAAFAPLEPAALLRCASTSVPARSLAAESALEVLELTAPERVLRVLPGAQADWFDLPAFLSQEYRIAPASSRMGIRLQGIPLRRSAREMVSEAVAPGAVQVTNEGQCIILGVDGQTIGGYPKAAHVIRADLDRLGQLRPGDTVRFELVSPDDAERLGRHVIDALRRTVRRIQGAEWLSLPSAAAPG